MTSILKRANIESQRQVFTEKSHLLIKPPVICALGVLGALTPINWGLVFDAGSKINASSAIARTATKELYQQMAHAQLTAQQDNDKLILIMKSTAQAFSKYCQKTGGIPRSAKHLAYLEYSLSQLAGDNPYATFPYRIAADDPEFCAKHDTAGGDRHKIVVRIKENLSPSPGQIAIWRTAAPSDWAEMPGTITIVHADGSDHNDLKSFCIWGAGVDGQPIKDNHNKENVLILESDTRP